MAPYPTKDEVAKLVSHLSSDNFQPFYDRVDPNVTWDVLGSTDASGHFTTLEAWKKGALETAGNVLTRPLKFKPVNVVGGGDQAWAVAELEALDAVGKDGTQYPQKYCWVMRFNERGIIVQVRVYADTLLAQTVIARNS